MAAVEFALDALFGCGIEGDRHRGSIARQGSRFEVRGSRFEVEVRVRGSGFGELDAG